MSEHVLDDSDPKPSPNTPVLEVYQVGELTVVGFGGRDVPDEVCIAAYRDQLKRLIEQHKCQTLAFDCTGVKLMPSGMLGLLTSLRKQVGKIELYNPSVDVVAVLKVTNLLPFFEVRELPK